MLSLTHLRYFHDAAALGSIAAAAVRHRVSASAVSQAVRNLESHFDSQLLAHTRNRFELTDEGRELYDRSIKLLAGVDSLEDEMRFSKSAHSGTVVFATQQSIAHTMLPGFMARMQKDYPRLAPKLRLAPTDVVQRWITMREIEFGLSVDNVTHDSFMSMPIYEGEFVLVQSTRAGAVDGQGFITPGEHTRESTAFRREYEAVLGKPPQMLMEIRSWGVVKRFAEMGMGIGLIPDYLLRFEGSDGLKRVDLGLPRIPYSINAFHCRKRNSLSKNATLFLNELENFVKGLSG